MIRTEEVVEVGRGGSGGEEKWGEEGGESVYTYTMRGKLDSEYNV